MDLGKALQESMASTKTPEDGNDDMASLYTEFKEAKDSKAGLRALKQLVRLMK